MIHTRTVDYEDGSGRLALPDGEGPFPAVLLGHEGTGLNDFQRDRADALAELGYAAFAMDYSGGRWFGDPADMMAYLGPLLADPARLRAHGHRALDVLLAQPGVDPDRVAAVGYGTGGTIVLELGRDGVQLRGIAVVNAPLASADPRDAANLRCPVLVCVGSEDPMVTPEVVATFGAEMRAADADWRVITYGGAEHAFHHPPVRPDGVLASSGDDRIPTLPGVGYHERHAERAWRDVLGLLEETLAPAIRSRR